MAEVNSTCGFCGKQFIPKPGSKGAYCSRHCWRLKLKADAENKPIVYCKVCDKGFESKAGKSNLYCGLPCYRIAQKKGDYKRGTSRIHECSNCKSKVVGVSHNRKRNGEKADHIFCNRACYDAFRAKKADAVIGRCKLCDKPITSRTTSNPNAKYCSWDCRVRDRKAKPKNCMSCGCWFTPMKWHGAAGRYISVNDTKTCSTECYRQTIRDNEERKEKISKAFTGRSHPNWQGGPQMRHAGSRGSGWLAARRKALKRDRYKCQHCGMTDAEHRSLTGKGLEVHHKIPFWQYRGDNARANALSNLVSLCKSCHQKADWKYRKENPMQMGIMF